MEFKVGDWVRFRKDKIGKIRSVYQDREYTIHGVISPAGNGRYCAYYTEFSKRELTLWQPKEGEWCWFVFDSSKKKKQYELGQFDDEIHDTDGKYYTSKQNNKKWFDYCEPFIGELPSSLKDS